MLQCLAERNSYGDKTFIVCHENLKQTTAVSLVNGKAFYHQNCYKSVVNKTNISTPNLEAKSPEIPLSITPEIPSAETKTLRSKGSFFDKSYCIICQKSGGKLHKVAYISTGSNMVKVAQQLTDQSLFIKLNSVPDAADAVANDVQYHLTCWVTIQRKASKTSVSDIEIQEIDDVNKVVADIEILNIVKCAINNSERKVFLDMNSVNTTYNNLLGKSTEEHANHKRYLKQLLVEKIINIVFARPKSRREAEIICSKISHVEAMENYRNSPDEFNELFDAAFLVRKDILNNQPWNFTGNFEDFELPVTLKSLLQWIIIGPKSSIDMCPKKKEAIDITVRNIGEIIVNSVKTKRQASYNSANDTFRDSVETPFSVGLGLYVHQQTRCKKVINTLNGLHLSIPHKSATN